MAEFWILCRGGLGKHNLKLTTKKLVNLDIFYNTVLRQDKNRDFLKTIIKVVRHDTF